MKDKVLKLCRRLKKCTLDDLVSFTEVNENIINTALIYLENDGSVEIKNNSILYIDTPKPKGRAEKKNINLMFQFRTPEEIDVIIKGFCLLIPPNKMCYLINVKETCMCDYYAVFRKMIYDRQYKKLLDYFIKKPQDAKYRKFYEKYSYFYMYENQVFVSEKFLITTLSNKWQKEQIKEFKAMYCYLSRIESHHLNERYLYHRLAEYIWRRNKEYESLYKDLKYNLLNLSQ